MWEIALWLVLAPVLTWLLLLFVYPYGYRPFKHSDLDKIPGPKSVPLIGNLYIFLTTSNAEFYTVCKNLREVYGPTVRIHGLGRNDVLICDPDSIEKVLSSTRYIKKSTDYNFLTPWLRKGLLISTGSKWHSRRKILTPAFHFKILEDYLSVFNRNTNVFIEKIRKHLSEPFIKINNFTTLLTLDIICETAMGVTINAQDGQEVEYVTAVHRMSEIFQIRQLTIRLHRDLIWKLSPLGREESKLLKTLHGFTQKIIKDRRKEYRDSKSNSSEINKRVSKKRLAFLDQLIEVSEKEEKLTDLDIQEEVDTFMFEGHDTTSSALSWGMHLIGAHPDVQEKILEELNEIFGDSDRLPTYEDLTNMKYLEQVIKETLRMFPSVPGFGRLLESEIEVSGYSIPAGVNIIVAPILLQRDPEHFPDPEKFDPDRFLPEACQTRHPYSFIPFSAGPRSCIGQRFALMEEKVVFSTVLRNFRLESMDKPEDIIPLMELILRPKNPLHIRFIPRKIP